jgi:excisionase family DNA binding protein
MNSLLTVADVSQYLGLHPQTVYRQAHQGKIPCVHILGNLRFEKDKIEKLIDLGTARNPLDSLPKLEISLEECDRLYLKGGKSAVGKNTRRWRYAFGAVYLRKTKRGDRWYIDYRNREGRRIRQLVMNAQSRGEAVTALLHYVREQFDSQYSPLRIADSLKFDELADRYLKHAEMSDKKSWRTDRYRLKALRLHFGKAKLKEIAAEAIIEYRAQRMKAGLRKSSTNREMALLKTMFNWAIQEGLLDVNPVRKIKFYSELDNVRDRLLSEEEEERLLATIAPHARLFIVVALHTGLRFGEIKGLKWKDVSFEKAQLKIENTKSKKARFVPINSMLLELLKNLKTEDGDSPDVFRVKDVHKAFENACSRAGIEGLTFHDLRRTFGTRLIEKGVDIVTISKLYGHSSVLVTQRYLHPRDMLSREAVELLAKGTAKPTESAEILSLGGHKKNQGFLARFPNRLFSMN